MLSPLDLISDEIQSMAVDLQAFEQMLSYIGSVNDGPDLRSQFNAVRQKLLAFEHTIIQRLQMVPAPEDYAYKQSLEQQFNEVKDRFYYFLHEAANRERSFPMVVPGMFILVS